MISEIGRNETSDIKEPSVEKFDDSKAKSEMSFKEAEEFWKKEFHDLAEQAKAETQGKHDVSMNDKQLDIQSRDLSDLIKDYIDDLKNKSECPDTIPSDAIDTTKLEIKTPEEVAEKREEFDDNKKNLRKEWENINNKEWPKYENDVTNSEGKVIRKAGDNYDAHHIRPLQLGGDNTAENITPMDVKSHSEVHSSGGSCNSLVERVKGDL